MLSAGDAGCRPVRASGGAAVGTVFGAPDQPGEELYPLGALAKYRMAPTTRGSGSLTPLTQQRLLDNSGSGSPPLELRKWLWQGARLGLPEVGGGLRQSSLGVRTLLPSAYILIHILISL